jgi:hypothetical protein
MEGCMDRIHNNLAIKVILVFLFILIIFIAFIMLGLSDVCAEKRSNDKPVIFLLVVMPDSVSIRNKIERYKR